MLTTRQTPDTRPSKFPSSLGKLQNLARSVFCFTALALTHCADQGPEFLPAPDDTSTPATATAGVPCEVAKLVASHCVACHGQQPITGVALISYADLTAASPLDPSKKIADRMLTRMESPTNPMPPAAAPTIPATELTPLQTWLTAGTPKTTCTAAAK